MSTNHVGVDRDGSLTSVATAEAPFLMASDVAFHVWIDYDGPTQKLGVHPLIGFTAATGGTFETHHILALHLSFQ